MTDARRVLNGINLNLLLVLDALLRHNNATRAAEDLGVTPSAVSHSLRELRAVFGDPLFVRTRYGLAPTVRAKALTTELGLALKSLGELVSREEEFDPATATRRCAIACADDAGKTVLPAFVRSIAKQSPGITLEFCPHGPAPIELLESGGVDFVLWLEQELPSWCGSEALYSDEMVCLVREDHPQVRDRITVEDYTTLPHIRIAPEGYGSSLVEDHLNEHGITRKNAIYAYSFSMAFEFVAQTDAILTAPSRTARVAAGRLGLRILDPPREVPGFTIDIIWHRGQEDASLSWLREQLRAAAN